MKDFYLSMKRLQLNSLKPFCLIFEENFIFMDIFTDKKYIFISLSRMLADDLQHF